MAYSKIRLSFVAPIVCLVLGGCTVGPNFVKPTQAAPEDWTSWRSSDATLRTSVGTDALVPAQWWQVFADPVLNSLEERALASSPDLQTAALRFAQARVQRSTVSAQRGPQVNASGGSTRQRASENGSATRLYDALGDGNSSALTDLLSDPTNVYQAGFDASWEIDLWGRVRRSIEAADADVAGQEALLDLARQTTVAEVARNYFELRTTQAQIRLARQDIIALGERLAILEARVRGGVIDHSDLERQRADLAAIRAQLPALLAQEGAAANQIALLLGEQPGSLRKYLSAPDELGHDAMPDLRLGLPSEVALRRPDIRSAEARLHRETANIGVARAELYPSLRIGARFGYESYQSEELLDWGSRTWSIGPSLSLPLFDGGRRKSVVELRELQQQEAAVDYQRTVLRAWQEIDDALSSYAGEQQQVAQLEVRGQSAAEAYGIAKARYEGGIADFLGVLDSQRIYLQARRDLVASQGRLRMSYVVINKAIGSAR